MDFGYHVSLITNAQRACMLLQTFFGRTDSTYGHGETDACTVPGHCHACHGTIYFLLSSVEDRALFLSTKHIYISCQMRIAGRDRRNSTNIVALRGNICHWGTGTMIAVMIIRCTMATCTQDNTCTACLHYSMHSLSRTLTGPDGLLQLLEQQTSSKSLTCSTIIV